MANSSRSSRAVWQAAGADTVATAGPAEEHQEDTMTRGRPTATTTTRIPLPALAPVDVAPWIRMTEDLVAQSGRLWVDLWFRNLKLATDAFWGGIRNHNRG